MEERQGFTLGLAVALPVVGGLVGGYLFSPRAAKGESNGWYKALKKPYLTPPNWVFGPVWTALYASMGYASYLVWRQGGFEQQGLALGAYAAQLGFNFAWSGLFFGAKRMDLALVDIGALWVSLAGTVALFHQVDKTAGLLLVPYLGWVSFASWLNYKLWVLNQKSKNL
ncbi:Translocator protein [Balamuthia mandrillaris]